jgi:hypothetical protein
VVTLKTITLDDGTTLQVGGNSEDCEILAVKPPTSLFDRPVIETDADEALNKAMEELFLHGDAVQRPVGFLPLDSASAAP